MELVNNLRFNGVTGVNLTAGATSTSATIPNDSSGSTAKFIRVAAVAACACHIKLGKGSATATATDPLR
jgi:hypothetical protein